MDELESLLAMNQEYWQHPMRQERQNLTTLQALGGGLDAFGLQVPDALPQGQQEFNRLSSGSALSRPQERYIATRQAAQSAHTSNQDASFEQAQMQSPVQLPTRPRRPDTDLNPYPRGEAPRSQQPFNAKHGQAIAFAKALGFGQQISGSPENAELAYQAMTMMLRRTPLPVLLSPKRKPQTAAEFQALLEKLSQPATLSTSKLPLQPT